MKRRTRWIIALAVTVALLLALLHGCQSSAVPSSVPSTEAPVMESVSDMTTPPETTEAAATELPVNSTESTQATESTQDTEASTEALVETEPETEAPTEPKPTEPKPTEPKPTEPKPTEPKPTTPTPTQPKPTEPKPTEPKPAPHSHAWSDWKQTKAPTCGAAGEETRTCSCGAKESRSVAATGNHSWNETAPTCTAAGAKTCKTCGKTESTAALGHNWVHHDEAGHWQAVLTCDCGAVFYSYEEWDAHFMSLDREERDNNHAGYSGYSDWIIDKPAYDECSRCGATKP